MWLPPAILEKNAIPELSAPGMAERTATVSGKVRMPRLSRRPMHERYWTDQVPPSVRKDLTGGAPLGRAVAVLNSDRILSTAPSISGAQLNATLSQNCSARRPGK